MRKILEGILVADNQVFLRNFPQSSACNETNISVPTEHSVFTINELFVESELRKNFKKTFDIIIALIYITLIGSDLPSAINSIPSAPSLKIKKVNV